MGHYSGQVLEQSHYYPFGLTITSTGAGVTEQPYKYQTKELEKSFGLEMYDFHARQYDPQLGRTWQPDPIAHLFSSLSPYSWTANNPIRFIDPTGMVIEPASQKEWDRQKQNVVSERDRLQGKIDGLNAKAAEKGWSASKLASKIGDMQDRVTSLNGSIANLGTLEASTQVYSLNRNSSTNLGATSYDPISGNIVFSYATTSTFVHETRHGGQFESGDMAFNMNTGLSLAQDIYDEVGAYKAQFAYDPSSVSILPSTSGTIANSFNSITPSWVQGLDGGTLYNQGGRANMGISPLNINSTKTDFLKAYPNSSGVKNFPSNFILKLSHPSIYYKK